ncbi:redox-regulated ATPase YchF [candidate division WWE3 bacterium CG08_land_8_20_14_0_20_40_13]|uniref:Redox-regulated ATPase YchF n=1 Tax=candidate division WWE3 bacterium CG08_land_8_20_14_0_20_40_13 TaxID=1975084 RepID=A0A2H0XD63_UNCKA|nr:MAG: redox-regulated ATPase YchF [candidate division WWE3 bacterium CG08_land_8_20_14_0_20_40_13]
MALSVGIVGLPNVGKSTLFNAILKRQVAYVANYPFATIEPNVGVVEVPDFRVDKLSELSKSEKKVYSTITFIDIAGLVKGASTGAGLGNKFLSHIREVDLIMLLLRDFEDSEIIREGSTNPESDAEVLLTELKLKDLDTLSKSEKGGSAPQGHCPDVLKKATEILDNGQLLSEALWTKEELEILSQFSPLTIKPILKVHNVSEKNLNWATAPACTGRPVGQCPDPMKVSAKIEFELASLSEEDQGQYLIDLGLVESPLNAVIKRAYEMLNLRTFLTTGVKESRAWKFVEGWDAQKCAGVIHSDFERLFIAGDVIPYEKFIEAGSLVTAKDKGWVRLEGKEYIMKDGDVVEFRVGRG